MTDILAVDDNPANLLVLSGMLKERGYKVRVATSGSLAMGAVAYRLPDLILLDINMPGMDGYEVCRRLKQDEALSGVPVIFLSAFVETKDKVKAFSVGGVDYITKPFQLEEVEARIELHMKLRRLQLRVEEQNSRLQESYKRLSDLERLRDDLVHMVAHDMRSPLGAMSTSLQLLKKDLEGEIPLQNLDDIEAAILGGSVVIRLLNNLLDVSRLEAGMMPLEVRSNDLVSVARDSIAILKGLAPGREVVLAGVERIELPCDGDVVRRVVDNLVANGLKHTPTGGTLRVVVEEMEDLARVSVCDPGAGMAPEHLERIFDKFVQAERRGDGSHSSGIGLTFCRMAVKAHRGRIGVLSKPGEGSTFWFTLPLA